MSKNANKIVAPKSIVLVHRRNMEYLNEHLVPHMRDKFSTQFIILFYVDLLIRFYLGS